MISKTQAMEIEQKILKVYKFFWKCKSIEEVIRVTGISRSSVQRYLTNNRARELVGNEIFEQARKRLTEMNLEGKRRGGINYSNNNVPLRDEQGHFKGSKRK